MMLALNPFFYVFVFSTRQDSKVLEFMKWDYYMYIFYLLLQACVIEIRVKRYLMNTLFNSTIFPIIGCQTLPRDTGSMNYGGRPSHCCTALIITEFFLFRVKLLLVVLNKETSLPIILKVVFLGQEHRKQATHVNLCQIWVFIHWTWDPANQDMLCGLR